MSQSPDERIVLVSPDGREVAAIGSPAADGASAEVSSLVQQPAKVMRVGSMIRQLREEVHTAPLDEAARARLRDIHARSLAEHEDGLAPDLVAELERLSLPFTDEEVPSESELRIAQAQLVGWLEGLFYGIQTALFAQQMAARAQFEEMRRQAGGQVTGMMPPGIAPEAADGTEQGSHGLYL